MSTMMTPYLTFSGRCEEAIEFYREAVGAECVMKMRFNESPDPTPEGMLQPGFEDNIMHAEIKIKGIPLMMSDGCEDQGKFGNFSLALQVDSEEEVNSLFDALAEGGDITMPLGPTFWSPRFGMLTDRFGLSWLLMIPGEESC